MISKGRITIRFLFTFVLVASLLAIPLNRVNADENGVSKQGQTNPSELQTAFAKAAKEFHVPQSILMSVGYNESRWNQHHGHPSTSGGYGIMHLTQVDQVPKDHAKGDGSHPLNRSVPKNASFHTLDEAAHLLGVDPNVLKTDPVQNIRGGAALLAKYVKQTVGETPDQPADWYGAIAKYSGSKDRSVAEDFADRVYQTIQQGAELTVEGGQHVVLSPKQVNPDKHTIHSLHLKQNKDTNVDCPEGLNCQYIPAAYKQFSDSPGDYGNYDLANRPKDDLDIRYIIIHDTEGSYTSAINTFQGQSYTSANFLIRSADGKVAEMVKPENVAWQAGNWYVNMHSIGIEHEGYAAEGATWFSEPMYHASAKLVKYLANRYHIPLDREHIIGHDHVPGLSPAAQGNMHWDPATFWDWGHFFDILGAKESKPPKHKGEPWKANGVVTIKPNFQTNKPPVTYQGQQLKPQPSSFVYLRTAPDFDAPLISDPALHPNGGEGTTAINDWGDKAVTGQHFYRADRKGDWSAIYYGGKKVWFYDPNGKNADLTNGMLVTPKAGKDSIPVYGAAYPEDSAYDGTGISEPDRGAIHPLPYTIPAGQMYVADGPFKSDYYYAKLYNQPSTNKVVKGKDEYYQISFNHRIAFVKKSDVDLVATSADDIKEIVQNFDEIGAFTNDQAVHALQVHLSAVSHYEEKGATDKVIKHLKDFRVLLKHQKKNDLLSDDAYEALQTAAVSLIIQTQGQTTHEKRQLRAAWVATVSNIDWPSRPGLSVQKQKQEFTHILDEDKAMGMNAAVVQVKPTADAFWPSKYAPWSKYLTGVQGKDPGYDPLAFMVKEAHKRNLEFHAWFNPYRVANDTTDIDDLAPNHPAREHPDWVVAYGGQLYYNPGIPEVRKFIIDSIVEAVKNYDIDAVHLDDYFYPYPVSGKEFDDEATYQKYGAAEFPDKGDWRRHNVNLFVKELSERIKDIKSYVKFGISPFGIWRNQSTDPAGSDTAGLQSYDAIYADSKAWVENGWLDYITPQIYWNLGYQPAAYEKLVDWWTNLAKGKPTQLYIGQAVYKIGNNPVADWSNPDEMPNQLKYNMAFDEIKGSMFFSNTDLEKNPLGFTDRLKSDLSKHPALVPTMPWLGGHAPEKPELVSVKATEDGNQIVWKDHKKSDSTYYVIYRFTGDEKRDFDDPANIVDTVRKDGDGLQTFVDQTAEKGKTYSYAVTAVDRLHHESKPSQPASVGK